jgi:hypothetical protein
MVPKPAPEMKRWARDFARRWMEIARSRTARWELRLVEFPEDRETPAKLVDGTRAEPFGG